MNETELETYAENLGQTLRADAESDGAERMLPEVLATYGIECLIEAGEVEEGDACHHKSRGMEVHGYGIDDEDVVNLFCSIHTGVTPPPTVPRSDVNTAFRRLETFWERCVSGGYSELLEESSDAFDMVATLEQYAANIRRVNLFLITDGVTGADSLEIDEANGVEIRRAVWDLRRIHRLTASGRGRESIVVDFEERFGEPLPCLSVGTGDSDYDALLAVFPGEWLGSVYHEFGARLLELNVRSFLQATGKVNRGMRDTLAGEPERFLAYNNGISATASEVELTTTPSGAPAISSIKDLQIVNGGQTTASVHRARVNKVDLSNVAVQAKITVVRPERLDEIVPLISRFANSQNRVSEADLSSNDPFHVALEATSRAVWTKPTKENLRQTRWFYERARGQYADLLARETTPARKKTFKEQHPTRQRFTKPDVAKFWNAYGLLPHEVSRGAQKNFTLFMANLKARPFDPTPDTFELLIAKAILWKESERIIGGQRYGGYRANLVAYSVAKLAHATGQRIDLRQIWRDQALSAPLTDAIADLSGIAWSVLTEKGPTGANVTEWAKRKGCWEVMRAESWSVPSRVEAGLVRLAGPARAGSPSGDAASADPNVLRCNAVAADAWFAIANWAKETDNLAPWQRKIAFSVGRRIGTGTPPSTKQALQGVRILDEARDRGFDAEAG